MRDDFHPDCAVCVEHKGDMYPAHTPSLKCLYGAVHPHCSCPRCFG